MGAQNFQRFVNWFHTTAEIHIFNDLTKLFIFGGIIEIAWDWVRFRTKECQLKH